MSINKHTRIRERIAVERREADYRIAERPPQRRKEGDINRLFNILDDIAVEKLRSQAFKETAAREGDRQ